MSYKPRAIAYANARKEFQAQVGDRCVPPSSLGATGHSQVSERHPEVRAHPSRPSDSEAVANGAKEIASKDVHNENPRTKRHLDGCAAMEPEFVAR